MIIYMEQTLAIIANHDHKIFQKLVSAGQVKETESGIKYLVIKDN